MRAGPAFHHWRVFSSGIAGVCIEFEKQSLLESINGMPGFRSGNVKYEKIKTLETVKPSVKEWPFLKREPFKDEGEFRIVFESKSEILRYKPIEIRVSDIRRITLSPWLPPSIAESVSEIMKCIDGCDGLEINHSTLLENSAWRKAIE